MGIGGGAIFVEIDLEGQFFAQAPVIQKDQGGAVPVGVATGVYTSEQLTDAGAEMILPDLKKADNILQMILKKGSG